MFQKFDLMYSRHAMAALEHALPDNVRMRISQDGKLRIPPLETSNVAATKVKALQNIRSASQSIRSGRAGKVVLEFVPLYQQLNEGLVGLAHVAEYDIRHMTNRGLTPLDRFSAYKDSIDTFDGIYNAIRKLDEIQKSGIISNIKAMEAFRREFREAFISDIESKNKQEIQNSEAFLARFIRWLYNQPKPTFDPDNLFERILYTEISDANISLRNASEVELADVTSYIGSWSDKKMDFERNCAHVAPVVIATMYGGKMRATSQGDEYYTGAGISTRKYGVETYKGKWENPGSLGAAFDMVQDSSWPNNTFGLIRWGYEGKNYGHISVIGKVAGRACVIEGQIQRIITRNANGEFQYVEKDRARNTYAVSKYDHASHIDVEVLSTTPARGTQTEVDRAHDAWDVSYPTNTRPESRLRFREFEEHERRNTSGHSAKSTREFDPDETIEYVDDLNRTRPLPDNFRPNNGLGSNGADHHKQNHGVPDQTRDL